MSKKALGGCGKTLKIEITIEGPFRDIPRLCEKLKDLSPMPGPQENDRRSVKILETEKGLDDSLLFISRALRGFEGLELRVRNLAYSEPVIESSDEPFSPIDSLRIQPWRPSLPDITDCRTIVIDHEHAFGSGMHPTTILCLEALEGLFSEKSSLRDMEILDFGCGTGLIAIAAVKWGARRALGVEINPASVLTARKNVAFNKVDTKVAILEGSWESVDGRFDCIIANLVPAVTYRTGERVRRHLKPEGTVIVSGFGENQIEEMEIFFKSLGLLSRKRTTLKRWAVLTLSSPAKGRCDDHRL